MDNNKKTSGEMILRFGRVAIFAHWAHTVTFFMLALTGMIIYIKSFSFLAVLFGGFQGVRLVHRIMAVAFIICPLISLAANFKGFQEWMKDVTTWGKNEFLFLKMFPRELFGLPVEFPPQSQFNAGEKINSLLQVFGCTLLALSGIVIWFKQYFPVVLVQWALPVHDLTFILTFSAALGHAYMACGLPATRHGINGMLSGYVKEEWARHHYPLWVKKVKGDQA
ncbi:formate dehydrogenase subunit gamma [Thermincola ferriacetica]|uniref:Formate dehydrogenase gamma subunit n=2 Tax=Thermincola TaxID=278993 RepID=D5X7U7_THEPJ|nr:MULTISPECIES: cytochrome b/b6 domain-containing protein [Thermincola]ADG82667.1 formate dehydrogenase gamma subunit [Thermincola potens JR]KNZ68704.1 formate dehydrogenase subunit gamma [Thermincola ferriacetica]